MEQAWDGNGVATGTRVRGFDLAGTETYSINAPLTGEDVTRTMGDPFGGMVLVTATPWYSTPVVSSIVRVGTSVGSASWRYGTTEGLRGIAQASDGTIYASTGYPIGLNPARHRVVGLDGATGALKFAISPTMSRFRFVMPTCPANERDSSSPAAGAGDIRVDLNGHANYVIIQRDQVVSYAADYQGGCTLNVLSEQRTQTAQVLLYRMASDGTTTVTLLHTYEGPAEFSLSFPISSGPDYDGGVLPDDAGGVLAFWTACHGFSAQVCERRARYVGAVGVSSEFALPVDAQPPEISASGQVAYYSDVSNTYAFDMRTGTTLRMTPIFGLPAVALDDGSIGVGGTNGISIIGPTGAITATGVGTNAEMAGVYVMPILTIDDIWVGGIGSSNLSVGAIAAARQRVDPLGGSPVASGSNTSGQNGPMRRSATAEELALQALALIYPASAVNGAANGEDGEERGGLVCRVGQDNYFLSRLVTSHSRTFVDVFGQAGCSPYAVPVAHFHTHPPGENAEPTGIVPTGGQTDITIADSDPELVHYLKAPKPDGFSPPRATHEFRYQKIWVESSRTNVQERVGQSWQPYP